MIELGSFFGKMLRSCGFAGAFFAVLLGSHVATFPGLSRYDSILLACLVIQAVLVAARIETVDELKVLAVFHGMGLVLEVHDRARSEGFKLRLLRGPDEVQRVFELAGVADVLPFA